MLGENLLQTKTFGSQTIVFTQITATFVKKNKHDTKSTITLLRAPR
jgi:hypothetical protein